MKKLKFAGALLGVGLVSAVAAGLVGAGMATALLRTAYNGPVGDGPVSVEEITVEETVLDEVRTARVHLPPRYHERPELRYPVLVVLDGGAQDDHTAQSARTLAHAGLVPDLIVVGVPNVPGGRERDYLPPPHGEADRFLAFLERDLLPALDARYRTDGTRHLAGYSHGGSFVAYALARRPGLFEARLALSPSLWVGEGKGVARLDSLLGARPDLDGCLYLSLGTEESGRMRTAFEAAADRLAEAPPPLRWRTDLIDGADHGTAPEWSTPAGLRACLGGA